MTFIPPMLCQVLQDPSRRDDLRYVAEPKFDGQRAQVHVAGGRTVAANSRRELDLLRHAGCAWLREVRWPVAQAVLRADVLCWAILRPSGRLRHPVFVRWADPTRSLRPGTGRLSRHDP